MLISMTNRIPIVQRVKNVLIVSGYIVKQKHNDLKEVDDLTYQKAYAYHSPQQHIQA